MEQFTRSVLQNDPNCLEKRPNKWGFSISPDPYITISQSLLQFFIC